MRCLDDYKNLLYRPKETIFRIGNNDYYYKHRQKSHVLDISPTVKLIKIGLDKMSKDYDDALVNKAEYTSVPEALEITVMLLDKFHERVLDNKSIPVFCIFPGKDDVRRYRTFGTKRYSSLLAYFEAKGYKYIDGMTAFECLGEDFKIDDLYEHFYSTMGNKFVAKYINDFLATRTPAKPEA
jgi:hypothetical protein